MNISIIGAARSGLAAALLAKDLGHNVFVSELKQKDDFIEAYKILCDNIIEFEFGTNSDRVYDCELMIISPGVPPSAKVIIETEKRNIKIISELEFAWQNMKNPFIAITGTNGKTTTTALTAFILQESGRKAIAAGNIGTPLSSLVGKISDDTIVVAEVSSYQLDRIKHFKPKVAMILNITPDHLGYHGSMENYIYAKSKIFMNQNEKDLLYLNLDDNLSSKIKSQSGGETAFFSLNQVDFGIYTKEGRIILRFPDKHIEEELMLVEELRLPGVHNTYNSMAAALAARAFEIPNENIRDCLMKFQGVEHRLEFVKSIEGVDYINDSKATNVNATWYALSSYNKPIIWIAGGQGDNNDYSILDENVKARVKTIIALGEESEAIFNHFCITVRCFKEITLEDALLKAKEISEFGDVVLFTPACKSFDQFTNFEHRGQVFKEIVNNL